MGEISDIPLAVDMDGTLILTDMSYISIKRVLLRKPWMIFGVLTKEAKNKRAQCHAAFLDWLTGEHARGRTLILATASDRIVAEQVAAHVGLFSDVMASDAQHNLRGKKKAEALIARYGDMKFGYAGNSHHDLPVWEHSGQIIVVNPEKNLLDKINDKADIVFE
jgi:hypothetical protein